MVNQTDFNYITFYNSLKQNFFKKILVVTSGGSKSQRIYTIIFKNNTKLYF
jgi:hypothetical protein